MAIPSKQIGWGTEENLLWQISKQLETLTKVVYNIGNSTTTTTTSSSTTTTTTTSVPTTTTTTTATVYTIGQAALGGIIAYINGGGSSGTSGLVVTAADLGTAQWGCLGTNVSGAQGTEIGTGNQNTIDIMAGCATPGIAARLCGDLVEGGYSDWYLPSKDELYQLYVNRVAIGGLDQSYYWSSSENTANFAYDIDFVTGTSPSTVKTDEDYVRAIRSF